MVVKIRIFDPSTGKPFEPEMPPVPMLVIVPYPEVDPVRASPPLQKQRRDMDGSCPLCANGLDS